METSLFTRELTIEEKNQIISPLLGFMFADNEGDNHFVLYDAEGDEFYGKDANCQFNFNTLKQIFEYAAHVDLERGKFIKAYEIRKALDL